MFDLIEHYGPNPIPSSPEIKAKIIIIAKKYYTIKHIIYSSNETKNYGYDTTFLPLEDAIIARNEFKFDVEIGPNSQLIRFSHSTKGWRRLIEEFENYNSIPDYFL